MRIVCNTPTPMLEAPKPDTPWTDELLPDMSAYVLEQSREFYYIETDYRYRGYIKIADTVPMAEEGLRSALCAAAVSYLGMPYRWGGKSRQGLDCSGLCFMAYYQNGISIFRDAQLKEGFPIRRISQEALKPGDLLYYPGHVALYLKHGRFIHANQTDGCVSYGSFVAGCPDYRADLTEFICGSYF